MRRTKEPGEVSKRLACTDKRWTPPLNGAVIRPDSPETLLHALQTGRLDMRTHTAQDLKAMRNAIAAAPLPVAAGVCRDLLAFGATMLAALQRAVTRAGEAGIVGEDGQVNPLITKFYPELQRSIIAASNTLLKLEQASGQETPKTPRIPKSKPKNDDTNAGDVSALVLELSAPDKENCND